MLVWLAFRYPLGAGLRLVFLVFWFPLPTAIEVNVPIIAAHGGRYQHIRFANDWNPASAPVYDSDHGMGQP